MSESEVELKFGEASFEVLSDFLTHLNYKNKSHLESVSSVCGSFKHRRVVEHVFLICEELRLEPLVYYHSIGILDQFMVKHIQNLFSIQKSNSATSGTTENYEELIFKSLSENFHIFIISSVQIASKLALHTKVVDIKSACRYLQSVSISCSKHKLLESELLILKTLQFNLNIPNPLLYVETLLEVLGHNDADTPVSELYHLCRYILQFIYLQREQIYQNLLTRVTASVSPSAQHREEFVAVMEDCMLLAVCVITVSAYIHQTSTCKKVVEELSLITGISTKSILDFSDVTLHHITKHKSFR